MWTTIVCSLARASDDAATPEDDATERIVVTAVRSDDAAPVTRTELTREELDATYHGQEVPYVLATTPGVMAWGDTGLGAGYSYLSLRGIQQTRLDVTLDGVPLADMEDMGVYLSNLVDFQSSIESVEVQRGTGTAAGGTPSFAGAVHFESRKLSAQPGGEITLGFGSFGTARASMAVETGAMGPWRASFRTSGFRTAGFRERSDVSQGSGALFVARTGDRSRFKLTAIAGRERQHLSFYATEDYVLAENPAANPLGPDARDEFGQEIVQLQYGHDVGDDDEIAASAYWNGARGWYSVNELYWDPSTPVQTYALDGGTVGAFATYVARTPHWNLTSGVHGNGFRRVHERYTVVLQDYRNVGTKTEVSAFAKAAGTYGAWHPYADLQLRRAGLAYTPREGGEDFPSRGWTFLNPKAGVRFAKTDAVGAYASVGLSGREPTRSDLFGGDDYDPASFTDVVPEKVLDVELGMDGRSPLATWAVNAYAMELFDEIALTGELLPTGLYRRVNVERSWRRGVEAEVALRPVDALELRAAGSLAQNRLAEWTQAYDVIDAYYYWTGSGSETYTDVPVLLAPWAIGRAQAVLDVAEPLSLAVGVRGASSQHLDNTGDPDFMAPGFALVDADVTWRGDGAVARTEVALHVENATNTKAYPSGYSWRFVSEGQPTDDVGGVRYFYPHAPRSVLVNVTTKF